MDYFKTVYPSTLDFAARRLGSSHKKIPGFGFLMLASEDEAKDALKRRLFYYKGRHLKAEPYLRDAGLQKHKEDLERKRVFVGHIPATMNSQDLWRTLEEEVGPVESAYIVSSPSNSSKRHRGFGYVIFGSHDIATEAIKTGKLYVESFMVQLHFERAKGKRSQGGGNNRKQNSGQQSRSSKKNSDEILPGEVTRKNSQGERNLENDQALQSSARKPSSQNKRNLEDPATNLTPIPIITQGANSANHSHQSRGKVRNSKNSKDKKKDQGKRAPKKRQKKAQEKKNPKNHKKKKLTIKQKHQQLLSRSKKVLGPSMTLESGSSAFEASAGAKGTTEHHNAKKSRGNSDNSYTLLREVMSKNGWKRYCLKRLDHTEQNLRISAGGVVKKLWWF